MAQNPKEKFDTYDNGSPVTTDTVAAPTNYYTAGKDVRTLWSYLKDIDPTKGDHGKSVVNAITDWQAVADHLAALRTRMHDALANVNRGGQWKGPTADLFTDVANRIVDFGLRVERTARYEPRYATFHEVSSQLDLVMSAVHDAVTKSPYANNGVEWTRMNTSSYNFGADKDWQNYWNYVVANTPSTEQYKLPQKSLDDQYTYLHNRQWMLLAHNATYLALYYATYQAALPHSPSPTELPSKDNPAPPNGSGQSGLGFTPPTLPTTPPLSTLTDPAITGLHNVGPVPSPLTGRTGPEFPVPSPTLGGPDPLTHLAGVPLPGLGTVPGLPGLGTPGALSGSGGSGFGLPGVTGPGLTGLPGSGLPGGPGAFPGLSAIPGAPGRPLNALGPLEPLGPLGPLGAAGLEPGIPGVGTLGGAGLRERLTGGIPGEPGVANPLANQMQAGALATERGLAAEAAVAAGASAARGGPMMPPPMGGMGMGAGNQDKERGGPAYLMEDEEYWTVHTDCPPPVLGESEGWL